MTSPPPISVRVLELGVLRAPDFIFFGRKIEGFGELGPRREPRSADSTTISVVLGHLAVGRPAMGRAATFPRVGLGHVGA